MADADDEEPAPPADLNIAAPAADTAMDDEAEPAAPMDMPMGSADSGAVAMDAETSGLDEQLVQAAQAAGIDLAFLEALPEELRSEVSLQVRHLLSLAYCFLKVYTLCWHSSSFVCRVLGMAEGLCNTSTAAMQGRVGLAQPASGQQCGSTLD